MALKGFDHFLEAGAVGGGHLDAVAEFEQCTLQRFDGFALVAGA